MRKHNTFTKTYFCGGGVTSRWPTIPEKEALLPGRPAVPTHCEYISARSSHSISLADSMGTGTLWNW